MIHRLYRQQVVPASLDDVWEYFATPHNLNEMTPDDMKFKIVHGGEGKMYQGQLIEYRVQFMPLIKSRWLTEIAHVDNRAYFVDEQRIGPYRFWYHEHHFKLLDIGVKITDKVTYAAPFGLLGDIVNALWIQRRLNGIFDYRYQKIVELFGAA